MRLSTAVAADGWAVSDSLFSAPLVEALQRDCWMHWQQGAFRQAAVGRGGDRRVHNALRNDHTLWLPSCTASSAQRTYLDFMEVLRLHLNRELYLGLFEYEAHFAVYPPGHFYRKHLDVFRSDSGRMISCVLYLNSQWLADDGGALRLYLKDPPDPAYEDIIPVAGRFVMFLSERFYHEVRPAHRERLSLTGWFKVRAI